MPGWNVSSGFGFGLLIGDVIKIFSPGRRRPPTTTGSQKASEVKGTTVGTLMADLAHGGTRVIVFVFVNPPKKRKNRRLFEDNSEAIITGATPLIPTRDGSSVRT